MAHPRKPPSNVKTPTPVASSSLARPLDETNAGKLFVVRDKDWAMVWGANLEWDAARKLKERVVNRGKSNNARAELMPTDPELLAFCTYAPMIGVPIEITPEVQDHITRLQGLADAPAPALATQIGGGAESRVAPARQFAAVVPPPAPPPGPARDASGKLLDGPTMEEWTGAGYQRETYPPAGWAARSSPALDAYRMELQAAAAQAIVAQQAAPAAATCPPHDFQPAPYGRCTRCKKTDDEIVAQGLLEEDALDGASIEDLLDAE